MSSKLALKHKDPLGLKESKVRHEEKQEVYKRTKMKSRYLSLPYLTLSVFLVYWLIICPIIFVIYFFVFGKKTRPPPFEAFVYWIVAFSIFLVIMCVMLICWRRSQMKRNSEISVISKYGSDNVEKPLGVPRTSSEEDVEALGTKETIDSRVGPKSRNNVRESKKDLPPLVIHERTSDEDIQDTAVVHAERDEETRLNVASDYVAKSPLQNYLQLVTVSPSEEGEMKSPKTPMSPRDLFFIDLIRGAEEAERKLNSSKSRTYFFPSETTESDTKDTNNAEEGKNPREDTEDKKDAKNSIDERTSSGKSKRESSYFIADVESPVSEKTEVFLHIDPGVGGDPTEVVVEKPVLLLQSNENISQANY